MTDFERLSIQFELLGTVLDCERRALAEMEDFNVDAIALQRARIDHLSELLGSYRVAQLRAEG